MLLFSQPLVDFYWINFVTKAYIKYENSRGIGVKIRLTTKALDHYDAKLISLYVRHEKDKF